MQPRKVSHCKPHILTTISEWIPRLQRRFPSPVAKSKLWDLLQDELYYRGVIQGRNGASVLAEYHLCRTDAEWFSFAGRVFPPHQQQQEILGFLALAREVDPKVIMEIGTAQCGTQFLLGQVLESTETILALDLRIKNSKLLNRFSRPSLNRVFLEGSSYNPLSFERVQKVLAGKQLDILFIDGDHSYEGVSADYAMYRPLVRKGGLIAFHDIVDDHRTKFGRPGVGWAGGVPSFWRDLQNQHEEQRFSEFILDQDQDGMGIGVIHV